MNTLEVLPTEDNLIQYLSKDIIDRNQDITYFYRLLAAQDSACAIAIDGRWGSGKTIFVRQLKLLFKALNVSSNMEDDARRIVKNSLKFQPDDSDCSFAIYYDAWKNDNDSEPIYSLIYEITRQLNVDFSLSDKKIPELACEVIKTFSGFDLTGILEVLNADDPFKRFKEQKDFEDKIRDFITGIVAERGNRLIIFIDELDRCKPAFAVALLEQIKHYIVDDRITFVFSINLDQLQHTIKHHYGFEFDACRYLDRFFNRTISLPPANMDKFYAEIGLYDSHYSADAVMKQIIEMFHFELREITRFCTQVKDADYEVTHNSEKYQFVFSHEKGKHYILLCIVPLLIGLQIANITKYDNFINGKDVSPLIELFDSENTKYILNELLDPNESFTEVDGKTTVTYEEVIKKLYNAIFVEQYDNRNYRTALGDYEFTKSSKQFAVSVAGMMSQYACLK